MRYIPVSVLVPEDLYKALSAYADGETNFDVEAAKGACLELLASYFREEDEDES